MNTVIVIGAGILGASTAYQLSRLGAKVLLIDREEPGQATAAAAGIICPWLSQRRNQAWYRLAAAGAKFYPELIAALHQEGERDTGYAQVGALCLHHDANKLQRMEERARLRREAASEIGEIARLDSNAARALFPPLAEGYSAIHISGAARVDGRALRDALVRAAVRRGAERISGDAVLLHSGGRVTGAAIGRRHYEADVTAVCAGAWARPLLAPLGISFHVGYQKAQVLHVGLDQADLADPADWADLADRADPADWADRADRADWADRADRADSARSGNAGHSENSQDTGNWPVIMPPTDQYLLAFEGGRVVMGATHEDGVEGYDTRITAGGMHEVLSKGLAVAPGLAGCSLLEARAGFRPFTPGFLPVIGAVPGWEGLLAANGLGASGLTVGPYLGLQLAKLALGHRLDIELEDYTLATAIG